MRIFILLPVLFGLSCATYGPYDCKADLVLVEELTQIILAEETDDEAKLAKRALYVKLGAVVASRGCAFVPDPRVIEVSDEQVALPID